MGGGDDILVFLAVEDIDGGEVTLGVTVLASLGSRHTSDLIKKEKVRYIYELMSEITYAIKLRDLMSTIQAWARNKDVFLPYRGGS